MNRNQSLANWKNELDHAIYSLNRMRKANAKECWAGRKWVKNCLWNFWYFGGCGGNPANAAKYFPERDNSSIC